MVVIDFLFLDLARDVALELRLREIYSGTVVNPPVDPDPYESPENLGRFFAGETAAPAACCSPAEQSSCCKPEDKAECCGAASGEGCGCR
jgi:hypothetical protein